MKVRGTFLRVSPVSNMANFNAAFGYDFYIVPLMSSAVDVSFAGITGASDFVDTATTVPADQDAIIYVPGTDSTDPKFTVGGTPTDYVLDGAANPIRLAGLTQASLETDTGSEDIYTYDDESKGFNQAVATTKSFNISLAGVADFSDAGYKFLRLTEANTVADNLRVKVLRVGPTGIAESIYGYGTLMGYTESNEVTSIVSWECSISGYGPYKIDLADNA